MNFKDYINELKELDNQEAKTELLTFYKLNVVVFEYFKTIDATIQDLLQQPVVSPIALERLKEILPMLIRMRSAIFKFNPKTCLPEYKQLIEKAIRVAQEKMTIGEAEEICETFFKTLKSSEAAFNAEQARKREADEKALQAAKSSEFSLHSMEEAILRGYTLPYKDRLKVAQTSKREAVLMKCACDSAVTVRNAVLQNSHASAAVKKAAEEYTKKHPSSSSSSSDSGFCFVATACYGDYEALEVLVLRKYRDEQLLTNWFGTLFVKFYYAVSPPLARLLAKSDNARRFMRKHFLGPIVRRIQEKTATENTDN